MLENFLLGKHKEIDKKAEREKNCVSYIVGIIEKEPEKFKEVFDPEGKISKSDFPEKVYNSVKDTIKRLDDEYTRPFGVTCSYLISGQKPLNPAVLLGWGEYKCTGVSKEYIKQNPDKAFPHVLIPTELGVQIINDYRKNLGYISTKEHMEKNKKFVRELTNSCV